MFRWEPGGIPTKNISLWRKKETFKTKHSVLNPTEFACRKFPCGWILSWCGISFSHRLAAHRTPDSLELDFGSPRQTPSDHCSKLHCGHCSGGWLEKSQPWAFLPLCPDSQERKSWGWRLRKTEHQMQTQRTYAALMGPRSKSVRVQSTCHTSIRAQV